MKPKMLLAILLIAFVTTSFAIDKKPMAISTREISISQSINRMIIGYNVRVILVADDNYPAITVTGESDLLQAINFKVKGNELMISASKNLKERKLLIHVPVKDLAYMELKSGSAVSVQGVVPCTNLLVVVNSDAYLALKYSGKATIKPADDCEFVYEREENYIGKL